MSAGLLERLLPARADNAYSGHPVALWIYGAVLLMKTGVALGTMFNGRNAAMDADGIALASFGTAGGEAFISLFAAWGLAQLAIAAIGWLVLWRYRALVPVTFALLLVELVARKTIFVVLPIARTGTAPGLAINLVLVALMVVGLTLALRRRA